MTAEHDAALDEIIALRARLARIEEAAGRAADPVFTTRQLEDRTFYKANETEILRAAREPGSPRIVEAEPVERPTREYPESVIPGWRVTGQDIFEAPPAAPKVKGEPK